MYYLLQVLFILGASEDAQQLALTLTEMTFRPHSRDPTQLLLARTSPPSSLQLQRLHQDPQDPDLPCNDNEPISGCPERVADYVRSSRCLLGDDDDDDVDSVDNAENEDETSIRLFVSPRLRAALLSSISLATQACQGRGFVL